jgi:hypothetical protein
MPRDIAVPGAVIRVLSTPRLPAPPRGFPHRLGKSLWKTKRGRRAGRQIMRFPLDCTRTRQCHEFAMIVV